MTLGEKIYRLRTEQGMSQENFGDMLGVSRQSVSKWETDQSVPELDKVVAISEMLGVSTDYLLKESVEGYQEQRMAQGRQQGSFIRVRKLSWECRLYMSISGCGLCGQKV